MSGRIEDLRAIAVYQKSVIVCIALNLLVFLGSPLVPPEINCIFAFGYIAVGLVGLVFVFLLASKIHGVAWGVLLAIFTFLPCAGLLVLLVVNGKATRILKQNGYKVGLMGASLSQFDVHDAA